jgi:hypothetical protein
MEKGEPVQKMGSPAFKPFVFGCVVNKRTFYVVLKDLDCGSVFLKFHDLSLELSFRTNEYLMHFRSWYESNQTTS